MIKGCNKRVIVMRDTGNEMIEEAIFIIKPGSEKGFVCEDDIIKHANSILEKNHCHDRFSKFPDNIKQTKNGSFMPFLSGMIMGLCFSALIILVF